MKSQDTQNNCFIKISIFGFMHTYTYLHVYLFVSLSIQVEFNLILNIHGSDLKLNRW